MTAFLLSWKGNNMRILHWFWTPKGSVSQYMLARSGTIRDNNPYLLFSLPTTLTNGSLLSNKGFRTALINSCDLSEPEKKVSQIVRETGRKLGRMLPQTPRIQGAGLWGTLSHPWMWLMHGGMCYLFFCPWKQKEKDGQERLHGDLKFV